MHKDSVVYPSDLNLLGSLQFFVKMQLRLQEGLAQYPNKKKKEPNQLNDFKKAFSHIGRNTCFLLDLETFTMMTLSFSGLLRYGKISKLCCCGLDGRNVLKSFN